MANLARWDPFSDMISLRDAMDQLFENALIGYTPHEGGQAGQRSGWAFPLDVTENDNNYLVEASLPGINPDDLDITVQDNLLTIKGEMKAEENKDQRYHLRERRWGAFSRSVTLPTGVDANNVQANYENGVLKLTLPKHEEARPKRISVRTGGQGGGQNKMIEGQATHVNTGNAQSADQQTNQQS